MDNGLTILYFILAIAVIIGISVFIAVIIERLKGDDRQGPQKKSRPKIDAEIEEVIKWVGVSEPVDDSMLVQKFLAGKDEEVVDEIAKQLSLPMKVTIQYRNENNHNKLAEVKIGNIPGYGSRYLEIYPCTVILYPGYDSSPYRFISVIAHELSHYVLRSLRPSLPDERKEERQTDLAVIFGGFGRAYKLGRKSYSDGTAGYLLDDEIDYIYQAYMDKLTERRYWFEKMSDSYRSLVNTQSDTLSFVKACGLLLDHPNEKILGDDMAPIGRCLSSVEKKEVEKIKKLTTSLEPFLKRKTRYSEMVGDWSKLTELEKILKGISLPEADDAAVLMKYTDKYK